MDRFSLTPPSQQTMALCILDNSDGFGFCVYATHCFYSGSRISHTKAKTPSTPGAVRYTNKNSWIYLLRISGVGIELVKGT